MVDLTVVILTKNEEKNLRKCVESFRGIVKRFVVVDSFSDDATEELCKELDGELRQKGAMLDFYQNPFVDHATQFNFALDNCNISTAWTMRIDADEELTEELAKEIDGKLDILEDGINGVIVRRRLIFMGRWIKHGGRYPERLLRIFRTGKARCEMKIMDEHIVLTEGKSTNFEHDLIDNNQKDLEWWTAKHNWYSNREVLDYQQVGSEVQEHNDGAGKQAKMKRIAKNGFYYKMPLFMRAHLYFIYRYYFRLGFLDGPEGRIFHFLHAYWYRFLVDAKMYQCDKKGIIMASQGDLKA